MLHWAFSPLGALSSHNIVRCVSTSLYYLLCVDIILARFPHPCCNLFQYPLLVDLGHLLTGLVHHINLVVHLSEIVIYTVYIILLISDQ